jgi:hypothetical protein
MVGRRVESTMIGEAKARRSLSSTEIGSRSSQVNKVVMMGKRAALGRCVGRPHKTAAKTFCFPRPVHRALGKSS